MPTVIWQKVQVAYVHGCTQGQGRV